MASHKDTGVTPQDFAEFDIVVVGGGTAGLALASRVAKSSSLSVGVLEAGLWRPDDDKINMPAFIGQSLMQPEYDWQYMTTPQEHSNNREYAWPRGKVLGGSSALNFLVWQRGHKREFDAWASMGNKGWDWKGLEPFFKRSATMLPPSTQLQKDNFAGIDETTHGSDGPVQVSYSAWYTEPQKKWMTAMKELGINSNIDGLRGDNSGVWASPATLDQKTWKRSYAAPAHYEPNRHLSNFKVLCGATASQILIEDGKAVGVTYTHGDKEYTVKAKREVVLSGGAINSPALLELSGVGSREVLEKAGVPVKVELDGVGRNLQEHLYCTASYELKEGFETWDSLRQSDFAATAMKTYQSQDVDRGILASAFSGFAFVPLQRYMNGAEIGEVKDEVKKLLKSDTYYANQVERQGAAEFLEQLDDETIPAIEYIFAPGYFATASGPKEGKNYFSILTALQHPFSRGQIHITSSKDPRPKIDPRYFSVKADLKVMSKAMKYCDKVVASEHLKDLVVQRQDPEPSKYKTEEDFDEFVKDFSCTEYHHMGTCAMGPKASGGVVDERLRVHGVKNLRVADASTFCLMPSSHIVAVVYAVGEKAAQMILEDNDAVAKVEADFASTHL